MKKRNAFFVFCLVLASVRGVSALQCCGDCDGSGTVSIGEVTKGINNFLGQCLTAVCPTGLTNCSGNCRDLARDGTNCGACGTTCPSGQVCSAGTCAVSCQAGLTNCSGTCVNLNTDSYNCGSCGRSCSAGQVCSAGACAVSCQTGLTNCSGTCVNLNTDSYNCGICGRSCSAGQVCSAGACAVSCQTGLTNCSGTCVNLNTDNYNCGICARLCSAGTVCSSGVCVIACPAGLTNCSGICTDLQSEHFNCGACANACTSGQVCASGGCIPVVAEAESNNSTAQADTNIVQITGGSRVVGSVGAVGDKDYFRIILASASTVRFEVFDEASAQDCGAATATTLRLFNASGTQLYADDTSGIRNCSALVLGLAAGTYYAQLEDKDNDGTVALYAMETHVYASNGSEAEPNDSQELANSEPGSQFFVSGDHSVGPDADYFAVWVPAGRSIRAEVIEGVGMPETCESQGVDSTVTLFDAAGTQLAFDDDDGRGYCSLLDGTGSSPLDSGAHGLTGGVYHLRVRAFGTSGPAFEFTYRLAVTIR